MLHSINELGDSQRVPPPDFLLEWPAKKKTFVARTDRQFFFLAAAMARQKIFVACNGPPKFFVAHNGPPPMSSFVGGPDDAAFFFNVAAPPGSGSGFFLVSSQKRHFWANFYSMGDTYGVWYIRTGRNQTLGRCPPRCTLTPPCAPMTK